MSDKNPESPATTSDAYDSMSPSWEKIQTVLDGTPAMRAAEKAYLPQHAEETNAAYQERLHMCTLFNLSKITLDSWVGRPFGDPIVFENVPAPVEGILDDVDLQGNDVHVFCRNWFKDGVAKAISHVYVDFPRVEVAEGEIRTLADDAELRPYWVHIRPGDLFFADAEVVAGREILREIRLMEMAKERDQFAEVSIPQIRRVFLELDETTFESRVTVELYRQSKEQKDKDGEPKWVLSETYPSDLPVIPLVTFYADRDEFMHGTPPLEDLVDLNIAHWQSTSDQRAVVTVARFPMLALSGGVDENKELVIGPHQWLYSPDPQGKFYYVEHSGAAIEAGSKDLRQLEDQMSEYGAEFLKKRPGQMTATARALDSAEATSPLQDVTKRFADALEQALDYTALWLGLDDGGDPALSTDFGPEELDQAELNTLSKAREMKDLSRKTYLLELQRRGLLNDELDLDEELGAVEQEALEMAELFMNEETEPKKEEEEETGAGEPGAV